MLHSFSCLSSSHFGLVWFGLVFRWGFFQIQEVLKSTLKFSICNLQKSQLPLFVDLLWVYVLSGSIIFAVHQNEPLDELMCMHVCCPAVCNTETSAEPSLQAKQLQLKRARLADDLNDKISHRPGPIELVHKNILSVSCPLQTSLLGNYTQLTPFK